MSISRFSTIVHSSVSPLTKQQITSYLASEHAKWCPPNKKIEWMNNWIQNGGSIPSKDDYEDGALKDLKLDVATSLRQKSGAHWNEAGKEPSGISNLSKRALTAIEKESTPSKKTLIDLGGSNSNLALWLLHKDWKVTVVDPSEVALHSLQMRAYQHGLRSLAEKNLTLACQGMETFTFPSNVSLITAQASLPYCDPSQIEKVWDNMYNSLAPGGRVAGNFFCHPAIENRPLEVIFRLKMSPWFATNSLVTSLLQNKGYEIENNTPGNHQSVPGIDFIGRKPK